MLDDATAYKLLKLVKEDPTISQRAIAKELGISLGKVNYCLNALVDKGLVKARNFYKSKNKLGYGYLLTTKGLDEKARITIRFLKQKLNDYEELEKEIEQIRKEAMLLNEGETELDN